MEMATGTDGIFLMVSVVWDQVGWAGFDSPPRYMAWLFLFFCPLGFPFSGLGLLSTVL